MEDVVAHGIFKVGLVTDEYDATEGGDSKPGSESIATGPYGKLGGPPSTIYYETPGGPKSFNFEIEPGHLDFLPCTSETYSKPFSSDSGSRKRSSTTGDSSSSGHSISSSGNPSSTTKNNAPKPSLSRVEAHCETRREAQARNMILQPLLENYTWEEVEDMIDRAVRKVLEENDDVDLKEPPSVLLGRGGFGNVYMGIVARNHEKPVAVKILGDKTEQGDAEFLNEVNLLSRINHVNLIKLVGYCQEASHRVLVYEYADQASIGDHLHGENRDFSRLEKTTQNLFGFCMWPRVSAHRVRSKNHSPRYQKQQHPPHQDLVAKVADFGLSKIAFEDDSGNQAHFSTRVKGTPGYLDPAYFKTGKLNEKSDIYSFGVVLLEMITGLKPIDPKADQFIGEWVKKQSGSLRVIVDSKLGGNFNSKSMKEVYNLALKCIDKSPKNRPDIRKVVATLRMAVETEYNTLQPPKWLRSLLGQT